MTLANAKPDLLMTGPLGTSMVNAASSAWHDVITVEAKITAAIAYAVSIGAKYCYVPDCFLPYTASQVTFNTAVKMIREGGTTLWWDIQAYGADPTSTTASQSAAIQAAVNGIPLTGGTVYTAALTFMVGATITLPTDRLVTLRGDGEDAQSTGLVTSGSVWKRLASQSGPMVSHDGGGSVSNHGPQVFHMCFDGGNQSNDLCLMTQTQGFRFAFCTFFNGNGNGLLINGAAFNFFVDFCRFFELGNTTAFPNGTSALVLNATANGGVVDCWITQPHFEAGRGSYITCNDPTGTHPVDGVSIIGGKLEWSGNNATGFNPPASSAIAMPFMLLSNASNWLVYATFFANGYHANATHIRCQNSLLCRFYTAHETTAGLADNQLPTFYVDLFSGPNPSGMYVSGVFNRGAQSATSGAHIRIVESSVKQYQIDPGSQFIAPASGVAIRFTNPTTGASSPFPISGGIQDKVFVVNPAIATQPINAQDGNSQEFNITTNIAVVIQTPTGNPITGLSEELAITFFNSSGGALTTAPTFIAGANAFLTSAAVVNPGNGTGVTYKFRWSPTAVGGARYREISRTVAF